MPSMSAARAMICARVPVDASTGGAMADSGSCSGAGAGGGGGAGATYFGPRGPSASTVALASAARMAGASASRSATGTNARTTAVRPVPRATIVRVNVTTPS